MLELPEEIDPPRCASPSKFPTCPVLITQCLRSWNVLKKLHFCMLLYNTTNHMQQTNQKFNLLAGVNFFNDAKQALKKCNSGCHRAQRGSTLHWSISFGLSNMFAHGDKYIRCFSTRGASHRAPWGLGMAKPELVL
eukprot:scaffold19735_cov22-Tisochrysis_lutea.AAC.4